MKIEFRKIPLNSSSFEIDSNSVKFLGNFSKISSKLAKIEANLGGYCEVDCCKCGKEFSIPLDESIELVVSDGIYSSTEEDEYIVVEVEDHIVDFHQILDSEIESLKSEYHICDSCRADDNLVEIEY